MRAHLENVERNLLKPRPVPEPLLPETRDVAVSQTQAAARA